MTHPRRLSLLPFAARLALGLMVVLLPACGGDDPTGPSANVEPIVGDWEARAMVVTSDADPSKTLDLVETGASFSINVQPSGQYTATLVVFGFPSTEIGTLRIDGDEIVFTREFPTRETSRARFTLSGDRITLVGPTEFQFDVDGSSEPATLESELIRQ